MKNAEVVDLITIVSFIGSLDGSCLSWRICRSDGENMSLIWQTLSGDFVWWGMFIISWISN